VPWDAPDTQFGPQWTTFPLSRLRHSAAGWRLYWPDRNTPWHLVKDVPAATSVVPLLETVVPRRVAFVPELINHSVVAAVCNGVGTRSDDAGSPVTLWDPRPRSLTGPSRSWVLAWLTWVQPQRRAAGIDGLSRTRASACCRSTCAAFSTPTPWALRAAQRSEMGLGSRYGPRPQVGNSQWTAVVSNSATTGFSRLYFEANRRPARTLHCGVFGVQPGLSKGLQSPRSPCVPAEGQLVDPTVRVVRVERLTALGHQFQYRQGAGERERSCRREAPGARSSTSRLPESSTAPSPARRDVKRSRRASVWNAVC
jgi:Protein of unknown function (DUF3024)